MHHLNSTEQTPVIGYICCMHGHVFEIKLVGMPGFGYVQVILTPELGLDPHVLFRPLNLYSPLEYKGTAEDFVNIDELAASSISLMTPRTRGPQKWRDLGHMALPANYSVPVFKFDVSTYSWRNQNWENIDWCLIRELVPNGLDCGYQLAQVRHLSYWKHCSLKAFVTKLSMLLMRKHGLQFADLIENEDDFIATSIYYEVANAVFYDEIDPGDRNLVYQKL